MSNDRARQPTTDPCPAPIGGRTGPQCRLVASRSARFTRLPELAANVRSDLVDNGSTDGTAEVAAEYEASLGVRVVPAVARRSAAYARNVGAEHAQGEFVVFVDADDVVDPGLLAAYASHLDGRDILAGPYEESLLNAPETMSWRNPLSPAGPPVMFERFPYFLMGNVAVRRSLFEQLGGSTRGLATEARRSTSRSGRNSRATRSRGSRSASSFIGTELP